MILMQVVERRNLLFRNRLNIPAKLRGVTSPHVLNPNCKHPKIFSGRCVVAYNIENPEAGNARQHTCASFQ